MGDLTGSVTGISVDSDAASRKVTVTFSLVDAAGNPVVGAEALNFDFQLAKLVEATDDAPAYWQSYINRSDQEGGPKTFAGGPESGKPTAVAGQTGVYTYTFCTPLAQVATFKYFGSGLEPTCAAGVSVGNAGVLNSPAWVAFEPTLDLAYDPSAPTRLAILGGSRTGIFVNIVQDFIPSALPAVLAATANEVVTNESCGACHAENSADRGQLLIMRTLSQKGSGHLGRRYQVEVCSACHNAASFNAETSTDDEWETLDLKEIVHKAHIDHYPQNAPFGGVSAIGTGFNGGVALPGVVNCRTCHDNQNPKILPVQPANRAADDKSAWQARISQQACNTCHAVDFTSHFGNQPGNVQCGECHSETRSLPVAVAHATPYPTPNNPELYPGAGKVEYEIASVTLNASNQPTVKFRIKVNGTPISLTAPPAGVTITGVNFKLAWSSPMPTPVNVNSGPAVAQPLDWNNTGGGARQYWNFDTSLGTDFRTFDQPTGPTVASIIPTLTGGPGVDPDGYYTTAPGLAATPLAFPADATLRGVAIESYLTFTTADGPMNISGPAVIKGVDTDVTSAGVPTRLRRQVVDLDNCTTCHERVGFHSNAGRMNNMEYCATCHNAEVSSSNLFEGFATFAGAPGGAEFFYRQQPNNFKEMIHSIHAGRIRAAQDPSDPFNFIRANPNATGGNGPMVFEEVVYPAQESDCQTCHKPGTYTLPSSDRFLWTVIDAEPALTGSAATFNPGLSIRQGPATGACGSCHISTTAKAHVQQNSAGGVETCVLCHGPGKSAEAHAD